MPKYLWRPDACRCILPTGAQEGARHGHRSRRRPGRCTRLTATASDALGRAGVDVDGACGYVCDRQGVFHVLVHDLELARRALMNSEFIIEDKQAGGRGPIKNQPGAAAALLRRVADAGLNVDLLYMTLDGELVLGGADVAVERSTSGSGRGWRDRLGAGAAGE